jgi:uncharacterized protein involved in exopolysaccharide biosynthesis
MVGSNATQKSLFAEEDFRSEGMPMADIADLERRVALLEQKVAAADSLRQQDTAEIRAEIAQLAAQVASFEQRSGRRLLALETRMANLETAVGSIAQDVREILRRLPT